MFCPPANFAQKRKVMCLVTEPKPDRANALSRTRRRRSTRPSTRLGFVPQQHTRSVQISRCSCPKQTGPELASFAKDGWIIEGGIAGREAWLRSSNRRLKLATRFVSRIHPTGVHAGNLASFLHNLIQSAGSREAPVKPLANPYAAALEDTFLALQTAECSYIGHREREQVLILVPDAEIKLAQLHAGSGDPVQRAW